MRETELSAGLLEKKQEEEMCHESLKPYQDEEAAALIYESANNVFF